VKKGHTEKTRNIISWNWGVFFNYGVDTIRGKRREEGESKRDRKCRFLHKDGRIGGDHTLVVQNRGGQQEATGGKPRGRGHGGESKWRLTILIARN